MNASDIKTLHMIGSKALGGAESFYLRLVNGLFEKGSSVVACYPRESLIQKGLNPDVEQYQLPMRSVYDPLSKFGINRLIKKVQPDIVMTYMGRATRLVNFKNKKRPIHVARLGGYYNLKGYRHADAWVGNTRGICDYLVKNGLSSEKVFHISNFIDIPERISQQKITEFKNINRIPDDALIVSTVARLHPNKGVSDLLSAFSKLPRELSGRPVFLVVAGDGELKNDLKAHAAQLGVSDRIRWLGWLLSPGIVYQSADLFVCPSIHEPLGNVILEAWAHAVPLVSTKTDGALELVKHEETGLLVEIGNSDEMASAIVSVLSSSQADKIKLIDSGLRELERNFSKQLIISKYESLYASLLKS